MVNDEETLSSFCAWFKEGGYLVLARQLDTTQIYVEFQDQGNGYYPKSISYCIQLPYIIFSLKPPELFSEKSQFKKILIEISAKKMALAETKKCLKSIFGYT